MAVPPENTGLTKNRLLGTVQEMYSWFAHKNILPAQGAYADQNPLLLEAFRILGAADAREDEFKNRRKKIKNLGEGKMPVGEKMPLL